MCGNFIQEWRHLQFNVDSDHHIFEQLFTTIFYLVSEFLFLGPFLFTLRVFTSELLSYFLAEELIFLISRYQK